MLNRFCLLFALAGMVLTAHLWVQKQRGYDQGCWGVATNARLESTHDGCRAPELEQAGQLLGVSTVVIGYGFYFTLAVLGFAKVLCAPSAARTCHAVSEYMVVAALPYSGYLFYVQAFVARAFCPLCLLSFGLVISIAAVLVTQRRSGGFEPLTESTRTQEVGWIATMAFGSVGVLVALLLFVDQLGTRRLDQGTSAQQISQVLGRSLSRYVDMKKLREFAPPTSKRPTQTIKVADWVDQETAVLGAKEGPIIIAFLDPNCPHCDVTFAAMMNLAKRYHDRARFVVLPCALWDYSMLQVQALELARQDGRYYDLWQKQFDHQKSGGLGLRDLEKIFRELNLSTRNFADRLGGKLSVAKAFQRKVKGAEIKSTPTVFIDGVSAVVRTEETLSKAVDEVLARTISPINQVAADAFGPEASVAQAGEDDR